MGSEFHGLTHAFSQQIYHPPQARTGDLPPLEEADEYNVQDHMYSLEELATVHNTKLDAGLTPEEAGLRLKNQGPNALPDAKQRPEWL